MDSIGEIAFGVEIGSLKSPQIVSEAFNSAYDLFLKCFEKKKSCVVYQNQLLFSTNLSLRVTKTNVNFFWELKKSPKQT